MADHIEEMIENCYWPEPAAKRYPGGRKNPDNLYRYRKWGYTVYWTYYGKESDEAWAMLLYSLEHQTKLALSGFAEEGVDDDDVHVDQDDVQQLRNLFTIERLEDTSKFEGLDVQGVRDFWSAESLKMKQAVVQIPGKRRRLTTRPWETLAMADCVHDFVLVADEATLKDVANGLFVVKAVSLELFGEAGWTGGWMRIPTSYLLDLWFLLCDWPSRPENALSFSGSEEELHHWIWPGDDDRVSTAGYSEIRKFPHYDGQMYHEDLWRKRRAPPTERCNEEGSSVRLGLRASPDSSPIFYHSSDEDRPLRRVIRPETRGRKEYEAPKITDKTDIVQGTMHLTYNSGGGYDTKLEARKDPANTHLYRRWGYPIYRTYYGPGSDKSWNTLLELLQQQTMLALEALKEKDQDDVQKLKELFYLEPHQDPAALGGLNIHELREYYCTEKRDGTRSRAMADEWSLFVLLADQSVLEDVEKGVFVVKTVCLIWTEHDEHPGFGWMRVPTRYMVELWQQLLIWKYRTDDALCFWGSEEDLHEFTWPGDGTGWCSKACPVYEKWIE